MHPEEVHKVVTIQNAAIRSFILLQIAGGIGVKSVKDYDQDLQNSLDFWSQIINKFKFISFDPQN